jgi:hypothetical protein
MDVFGRDDKLVVILNVKEGWCSTCKAGVQWPGAEWAVFYEGEGIEIPGQVVGHGDGLSLIVEFPLREGLPTARTTAVTLQADITEHRLRYANIPFCTLEPSASYKHHLAACTEVQGDFKHLLPEWVEYHLLQGYEHLTIFANEDPAEARALMRPFLEEGRVEVVDWHWPITNFMQQEAAENACIQRCCAVLHCIHSQ